MSRLPRLHRGTRIHLCWWLVSQHRRDNARHHAIEQRAMRRNSICAICSRYTVLAGRLERRRGSHWIARRWWSTHVLCLEERNFAWLSLLLLLLQRWVLCWILRTSHWIAEVWSLACLLEGHLRVSLRHHLCLLSRIHHFEWFSALARHERIL